MAQTIMIKGQVKNEVSNAPLAGVRVIAQQEGTEIQQETDKNGEYELNLIPGLWRISVSPAGYIEPYAYMYNFTSDAIGIDFHLQEGYSISGLVVNQSDLKPASGVIVEAKTVIDHKPVSKYALTNAFGKYHFSSLQRGEWQVKGSRGESQTGNEILKEGQDAYNVNLTLNRQMTPKDWNWGIGFFITMVIILLALVSIYLYTHKLITTKQEPELTAFIDQVDQAIIIAADATNSNDSSGNSLQTLRTTVSLLKDNWDRVSKTLISVTEGQIEQATLIISNAETAAIADNARDVESELTALKSILENQTSIYLWSEPPWNYLEVLFWSMAGILVSLLITSGYYLRQKRFYAEGIWMHASHLLSVPLLALVVVFLISQIKLTIQIEESQVALNISDPRLLAAISFIIAIRPWAMIEFVREAGSNFFNQIQSRIASSRETQNGTKTNK